MRFIGIDVGLSGGIAVVDEDARPAQVWSMPTFVTKTKISKRKVRTNAHVDVAKLADLMAELVSKDRAVFPNNIVVGIEDLHAIFGCGAAQTFGLGKASGIVEGVLGALGIPYQKIPPKTWKIGVMGKTTKDKAESILYAKRLFPHIEIAKSKDGLADALLIAEYMKRLHRGGIQSLTKETTFKKKKVPKDLLEDL